MAVTTLGGVMAFQDQVLKGNCGFTALPKDPQADSLYMPYIFNGFYLGKDAKHPNNAVAYMAIWNIMSQQDVKLEEVKEHWDDKEEGAQSPEIMENILNISNKAKVTVITSNMFGNEFTITVSGIGQSIDGGEPWSKIAAQVSPVADAGIRASFGG